MSYNIRPALVWLVLLLVAGGIASPFAISLAQESGARAGAPEVALVNAFTYQGRLEQDGVPANGSYDFEFRLYDALTAGNQIPDGTAVVAVTRTVTNGLFTAELDFGALAFDGNARWLEIQTKLSTSALYETLSPRQPLTPVPYALFALDGGTQYTAGTGLTLTGEQFKVNFLAAGPVNGSANTAARSDHNHFGQNWSGDTVSSAGLQIYNVTGPAIGGQGGSASGYLGYRGKIGVLGGISGFCGNVSLDNISAGVHGTTCLNDSTSDGVRGYSFKGAGVRGEGPVLGVLGDVTSGNGIGVYGVAGALPPSLPLLTGVHGYSNGGVGVYGRSLGSNSVGVKGLADGAGSIAGHFVGPILVSSCTGCANPSDQRLKHDIAPATRGLPEILALQAVSFAYNEDIYGQGTHLGFLAQDVQEVLPELVSEMESGYLRVNYDGVIPVLAKAIQEQQAQIEAMAKRSPSATEAAPPQIEDPRIDALTAEVATLRQQAKDGGTPWLPFAAIVVGLLGAGYGLGARRPAHGGERRG